MSEYWRQDEGPTEEQQQAAWRWFEKHRTHVLHMAKKAKHSYPPTDRDDCRMPELWVPDHWAWLLKARGIEVGE